jgi:hypothetical protein
MAVGLVGAVMGFQAQLLLDMTVGVGVPNSPQLVLILPVAVGLSGGFAFGSGLWRTWKLLAWTDNNEVWAHALSEVAREYGAVVTAKGQDGVGLATVTDGTRFEVRIVVQGDSRVVLWFGRPGLQAILITAVRGAATSQGDGHWRLVGRRSTWELWAESPATARGLLDEVRFVEDLNRLMSRPSVRAIRHDDRGVEVLAGLPEPQSLGGLVRSALLVARSLAVING